MSFEIANLRTHLKCQILYTQLYMKNKLLK